MAERKHTPGAWCVETYADIESAMMAGGFEWTRGDWDQASQGRPASVWRETGVSGGTGLPGSIEVGEHNAYLIASAPYLLDAAEMVSRAYASSPTVLHQKMEEAMVALREAIRQTRGEDAQP